MVRSRLARKQVGSMVREQAWTRVTEQIVGDKDRLVKEQLVDL
jgi:hypothetical protein